MSNNDPFTGLNLNELVYEKASMVNSKFDGVNLSGAFFYAVLRDVRFHDCNMEAADFDDVNLRNSMFNNINLSGVKFQNINFSNAEISYANLEGMKINGILVSELLEKYASS